jgi:cysteine synthase A
LVSVAVAADLGERYLDTVYDDDWVTSYFGPEALESFEFPDGPAARSSYDRKGFHD